MMRRKLFIIIFLLQALIVSAGTPYSSFFSRIRLGAEWGYSQCFFRAWNYNFISQEGSRFYENSADLYLQPNGILMLQAGVDLGQDRFNIGLSAGYIGVGKDNRVFPLLLRIAYFPVTTHSEGPFLHVQGGPAMHLHPVWRKPAWMGAAGAGYRICLSDELNLDLLAGIKYLYDHPVIPNPEGPGNVPERNIRKNDAGYCALDLTVAISF